MSGRQVWSTVWNKYPANKLYTLSRGTVFRRRGFDITILMQCVPKRTVFAEPRPNDLQQVSGQFREQIAHVLVRGGLRRPRHQWAPHNRPSGHVCPLPQWHVQAGHLSRPMPTLRPVGVNEPRPVHPAPLPSRLQRILAKLGPVLDIVWRRDADSHVHANLPCVEQRHRLSIPGRTT
jgi:hypothetical protein